MSPLALAWRSMARERARAALGVAGIAIVGALLFDMLLLSRGLLVSFRDLLESVGFDVRVTATETLPTLGPALKDARAIASAVRGLPEIEEAVPVRVSRAAVARPDGSHLDITLIGTEPQSRRRGSWRIIRGSGLEDGDRALPPILVNRKLAESLGVEPGSRLRLFARPHGVASALPAAEFHVKGILEFAFESSQESVAITTFDAFHAAEGGFGPDEADLILVASRPEAGASRAVEAIHRLRPDLHSFSTEQLLARFSRTDFSYFRQISLVLSSITFFFAFLLVATLLTVAVNQRFGEVAALRAIGFSRRRVAADLLSESALMVGTGAILSLPIGGALARALDSILREMPGIPARLHFFVLEPRAVLLQLVLLALAGLLAALYPIFLAVRLPIAATLRKEIVS